MRPILHCHCSLKMNWGNCRPMLMLCFSQRQAHEMSCIRHWAEISHWHCGNTHTHTRIHMYLDMYAYFAYRTDNRWNSSWSFPAGVLALENGSWLRLLCLLSWSSIKDKQAWILHFISIYCWLKKLPITTELHYLLSKRAISPLAWPLYLRIYHPSFIPSEYESTLTHP